MFPKRIVDDRERKLTEISAASGGDAEWPPRRRRDGELGEHAAQTASQMRHRGRAAPAIPWPPDGEDARVVPIAFFDQDVECEARAGSNREARGPIPRHPVSGDVLEQRFRRSDLLAKLHGFERGDPAMRPPVRGNLVAGLGNAPHEPTVPLRDPAKDEEGALRLVLSEEVEQAIDPNRDA